MPKINYKLIESDLSDRYLIRRFNDLETIPVTDNLGGISLVYICDPTSQIIDLSTNLLGIFKKNHFCYLITKNGQISGLTEYWDLISKTRRPHFPVEFEINNNYNCWSLPIKKLSGLTVPFFTGLGSKDEKKYEVECKVIHTPTRSNFWHFSLRWFLDGEDVNTLIANNQLKSKSAIVRWLSHAAKAKIKELVELDVPKAETIPKKYYKN